MGRFLHEVGVLDRVGGYGRLQRLSSPLGSMAYSGEAYLQAHAGIVRDWARKRAEARALAAQVAALYRPGVSRRPAYERPEYQSAEWGL